MARSSFGTWLESEPVVDHREDEFVTAPWPRPEPRLASLETTSFSTRMNGCPARRTTDSVAIRCPESSTGACSAAHPGSSDSAGMAPTPRASNWHPAKLRRLSRSASDGPVRRMRGGASRGNTATTDAPMTAPQVVEGRNQAVRHRLPGGDRHPHAGQDLLEALPSDHPNDRPGEVHHHAVMRQAQLEIDLLQDGIDERHRARLCPRAVFLFLIPAIVRRMAPLAAGVVVALGA